MYVCTYSLTCAYERPVDNVAYQWGNKNKIVFREQIETEAEFE